MPHQSFLKNSAEKFPLEIKMCEYSIPQFIFAQNVEWVADIKTKTKITLTFSSHYAIKKLATYIYMKLLPEKILQLFPVLGENSWLGDIISRELTANVLLHAPFNLTLEQ